MDSYMFLYTCQSNRCWDMVQDCSFHLWKMWKKSCVLSLDKRKRVTCLFCRVVFTRKENKSICYQVLQTEQHIVDHFSRPDLKLTVSQTDQLSAFSVLICNFSLTPNLGTDTWTLLLTNVESNISISGFYFASVFSTELFKHQQQNPKTFIFFLSYNVISLTLELLDVINMWLLL